jgi:hypothetical protein
MPKNANRVDTVENGGNLEKSLGNVSIFEIHFALCLYNRFLPFCRLRKKYIVKVKVKLPPNFYTLFYD